MHLQALLVSYIEHGAFSISLGHMVPNVRLTRSCCPCLPRLPSPFPANPYWAQRGPCFKYVQSGRQRLKMTKVISEAVRIAPAPGLSQKDSSLTKTFLPLTETLKAHFLKAFSSKEGKLERNRPSNILKDYQPTDALWNTNMRTIIFLSVFAPLTSSSPFRTPSGPHCSHCCDCHAKLPLMFFSHRGVFVQRQSPAGPI